MIAKTHLFFLESKEKKNKGFIFYQVAARFENSEVEKKNSAH